MDTPLMPDPASGETPSELGSQPAPEENGGLTGASETPEHTPDPAAPQPWPASPTPAGGWGYPPQPPPPPTWGHGYYGMPPAGAPMPASRRRTVGLAFGGALIAGGLVGALVMAAVGNLHTSTTISPSGNVPSQQAPNGFGGFGNRYGNYGLGGNGDGSSNSTGNSSTGTANIDGSSIAAKVDPALVDINSVLSDGSEAAGTGMILTSGGEVLTNNHVVEGAVRVTARSVASNKTYNVTVVGTDPSDDVALLQLQNASGLSTVSIGNSSNLTVGQAVLALGNAGGVGGTPSTASGEVTALGQTITATDDSGANPETLQNLIEINNDIQPGDSGGPLLNASGQVVGMDTAASSSGGGFRFQNVSSQGFSIPIDSAMTDIQALKGGKGAPSGAGSAFLGVDVTAPASGSGALVAGVEPGTPAQSAGIVTGDTITNFAGKSIGNVQSLSTDVKAEKPGQQVQVTWTDQNGASHTATVTLAGETAPVA